MARSSSSSDSSREDEIRRKIKDLKQEGKIKPTADKPQRRSVSEEYAPKIGSKLGGRRGRQVGRMLGIDVSVTSSSSPLSQTETSNKAENKTPKLGALDVDDIEGYVEDEDEDDGELFGVETEDERRERTVITSEAASDAIDMLRRNIDVKTEKGSEEMDEQEMVDAVTRALAKSGGSFRSVTSQDVISVAEETIGTVPETSPESDMSTQSAPSSTASTGQKTSGIGGSWAPSSSTTEEDAYQPKVGTWGAFPRPRNISVAYGGGKRVGAGVKTDESLKLQSVESTKEKLRNYREKMGIEVQSEKDHAEIIDGALQIAGRAMERGSYSTGVSALEKVTQYCSTRSKVGGKVFLELAMAYEAEGKTDEAIGLYSALAKSPIEEIKMNASTLQYGLESMNFMRNEANLKSFSRKAAVDTFIDATGFGDMTQNFDNVYNTAYIDLDKGSQYYRMLTENVVRSTREARQILLKAVNKGEVKTQKVVQALGSISRNFDDALAAEKKNEEAKNIPVDYAGRPIVSARRSAGDDLALAIGAEGFALLDQAQTLTNLDGEWRLQLMADKKGDTVDFFNSTLIWQEIDSSGMAYKAGTKGLRSSSQLGSLRFDKRERILTREDVSAGKGGGGGGGFFAILLGGGSGVGEKMTKVPQQILSVDSTLIVTRAIVQVQAADNVKGYFSVWRRVEPGTYARR